ncbi:MAG TPA: urea carboxylase-associated family protein [Alphaproteobacteria bacterium]|nr:urea carboxylase-associated family protein [Alphaproteobacteria bacterium]
MTARITIPARKGKAAYVKEGQRIRVINTHGYQIVDTWAFNRGDMKEFMSMEHCRGALMSLRPKAGQSLVTNKRRPILTLMEDTTAGVHDMLFAACDRYRYEELGCKEPHDNCTDNLAAGLKELGLAPPETPCPFNIFQNTAPDAVSGVIKFLPPVALPGQYVTLRADMDLVIAFSACPMDIVPVNGPAGGKPTEAHFQIL